ncbi:MAG: glycoside hydrolase family 3 N-terminal domain-containing protein [Muribaculaceae bacterium]
MKHIKCIGVVFAIFCSFLVTTQAKIPNLYNRANKQAMNEWVDLKMNTLTPREKIAQLIVMVVQPNSSDICKNNIIQYVERDKVGGLLLSKGTITEHVLVTNYAQSISNTPLLITLDGEWGPSMRMPDAPKFPKNMILGAISDDRLLYEYGAEVARECRRLGIHVNFAPVLDVNTNSKNPVIGYRSFGDSPESVTRKGIAYSKGLEDGGVMSVAKHFPGHGSTSEDSHKTLPVVECGIMELNLVHLSPFNQYIKAGLSGMLVGHLNIPALDNSETPSSLSNPIVTKLLKNKFKFNGLIFTDALGMKGVSNGDLNCVKALLAGNDVLLSPTNVTKEIDDIERAIKAGEISQSMIEAKCRKMLQYKYVLELNKPQKIAVENAVADVDSPKATSLINRLYAGAITVIKNRNNILPIHSLANNKIVVISLGTDSSTEFQKTCALYSDTQVIGYSNISNDKLGTFDTAIVEIYNDNAESCEALRSIAKNCKNVVPVFFTSPYKLVAFSDILNQNNVSPVIAYDDCNIAQSYAAQALYGGINVSGKLPVTIEKVAKTGTGIAYKATRLGYTVPEEVGVNSTLITFIDSIANAGVQSGAFPGCQVLVARNGKVICNNSYGNINNTGSTNVNVETLYDLASVSKATGTLPGIMAAYDAGLLNIDDKASKYIKQLRGTDKSQISIRNLLFHETGMPASLNMYNIMLDSTSFKKPLFSKKKDNTYSVLVDGNTYGNHNARLRSDILSSRQSEKFNLKICDNIYGNRTTYDTIMNNIYHAKLRSNKRYNYSCLNFCLLMNIEENVTHEAHNKYVDRTIFAPLGANHTLYSPLSRFNPSQIAVTEQDNLLRRQKMHGYVHDELACFSGGVQGNAGLFSNANDLAKLCQMWLNGGIYGGERILSQRVVTLFTTVKSPNSRRGLGFDKPDKKNDDDSPTCAQATPSTFGHLGFTGTCFWVDPQNQLIYIFLCNRVCPSRNNHAFSKLDIRPRIFERLYKSIDTK